MSSEISSYSRATPLSISREIIKSANWRLIGSCFRIVVTIASMVVLARFLSPQDFGLGAIAVSVTGLFTLLCQFGFSQALVTARDLDREMIDTVWTTSLAIGGAFYGVLQLLSVPIGYYYGNTTLSNLLPISGLGLLISCVGSVPTALVEKSLDYRTQTVANIISAGTNAATSILLALSGCGALALVVPQVLAQSSVGVFMLRKSGYKPSFRFCWRRFREVSGFGVFGLISNLVNWGCNNAVILTMGSVWNIATLGMYSFVQTKYSRPFDIVGDHLFGSVLPLFSKIQDDRNRLRGAFLRLSQVSVTILGPMYAGLIFGAPFLFHIFFGPRWNLALVPFQILCVAMICRAFNSVSNPTLYALGLPHFSAKVALLRLMGYGGVLGVAVLMKLSLIGLCVALTALDCSVILVYVLVALKVLGIRFWGYVREMLHPMTVTTISLGVAALANEYISRVGSGTLVQFLLSMSVSAGLLCFSVRAIPDLETVALPALRKFWRFSRR